jgi:hypothetical protein
MTKLNKLLRKVRNVTMKIYFQPLETGDDLTDSYECDSILFQDVYYDHRFYKELNFYLGKLCRLAKIL